MSYTNAEGRQEVLDRLAGAIAEMATAVDMLGEAYEHLDDRTAERMEEQLFRPAQAAYGRARRARTEFAARYGLTAPEPPRSAVRPHDARTAIERAADAARAAEHALGDLQDSMLPVEVGDAALRSALSDLRVGLSAISPAARDLLRTLGR